jgi:TonB family protein
MKGNLAGASPEGEYSYFYSNGRLESKGTFAEGYKTGFWEEWYSSGQIRTRGKHITTDNKFNFTNQPKTEYVIESFWDSAGMQLIKDGTGPYFSTYDGSKIKEKGQFLSGYKSGAWTGYFENGNILFEEQYDKGVLLSGISYNPAGLKFEYDERSKEKMPEFKGGMSALQRYLQKSLRYPAAARRLRAQGFVYVRFLVSEAGTLTDISLFTKGPDISLEEEALRVVRAMPEWTPGEEHGQPVRVEYVLPVRFVMQ